MIKAEHLSKRYRKKQAVNNVSFVVETGNVTGFLGPNGAGKSTTMRLMLGLDIGSGTTTFDGKGLREYRNPSEVVGILLEAKAFHPTRTARNHLRILAAVAGVPDSRVDEVLDIVGLKDVAKKKPGKFSLGMSQRLGIAAALLGKPKYLLLDEPANGLDPEGIAWLRQFIKDYADAGNAVFISSHLLSEMSQMADNIVVIGQGKLIASTSVTKLLAGDGHSGVFVRTPKQNMLARLVDNTGKNHANEASGLLITGMTSDEIGKLAFEAGIPIYELTPRTATLEQAFFDLTSDAQEFHAKEEKTK
ncbi:MAG TPA: ABC transporter ATP-binding protein [Candidatus Limnocylindrales bacterium]|nr:ABC transporter ATP-binding protein [Candidatus Limnocylindrales bacterium]